MLLQISLNLSLSNDWREDEGPNGVVGCTGEKQFFFLGQEKVTEGKPATRSEGRWEASPRRKTWGKELCLSASLI